MIEPRCIVEVRWGKRAGTKAVIPAVGRLRVGGTSRADLVIPHDEKLSGAHFELRWDGRRCTVRDLGSVTGTRLAGATVKEAVVPHGGWIQAGETDFMVYAEGKTPPKDVDPALAPGADPELVAEHRRRREAQQAGAEGALADLRAEASQAPLYAVLDAARTPRILTVLREAVEPHRSLYEGAAGDPLEEVAPYLVGPMTKDSRLLEQLVREGFSRRWGIFCASALPFIEVRRHLRRFLMVEREDTGERVYFRFYDPGVLRVFLSSGSVRQLDALFGSGVLSMLWTDEGGAHRAPLASAAPGAPSGSSSPPAPFTPVQEGA